MLNSATGQTGKSAVTGSSTTRPLLVAAALLAGIVAPASVNSAFGACVDYRQSRALVSELTALLREGQAEVRNSLGTKKPGDLTRKQEDLFDQVVESREGLLDSIDGMAGAAKDAKQALSKADPGDKDVWLDFFEGQRPARRLKQSDVPRNITESVEEACGFLSFQNFGSLARDFSKRSETKLVRGPRVTFEGSYPAGPVWDPIVFPAHRVTEISQSLQNNCYCRDGQPDWNAVTDAGNEALQD